jgi:flavodoxin
VYNIKADMQGSSKGDKKMTAIIYASVHHGNTKKIVDAIAGACEVDLIDATQITEKDINGYDTIGFASGLYYSKFHQSVLNFAAVNLPEDRKVFFICTCGGNASFKSIEEIASSKNAYIIGKFSCKGYDTFGPFKLVGGLAKGHPDDKDLEAAVEFYKGLKQ